MKLKKILKNTKNVFKRYRSPLLPLFWRFKVPDVISNFKEKMFYKSQKSKSPLNVFRFGYAISFNPKQFRPFEHDVLYLIQNFTLDDVSNSAIEDLRTQMLKIHHNKLSDIKFENRDTIEFSFTDGRKIVAKALTHTTPELKTEYPEITTTERYGKCHEMSTGLAFAFGENASVVTGKISTMSNLAPFLHSWTELDLPDETICIDYTNNITMKKEDYYWLFNAKPYEKITCQQLNDDLKIFERISQYKSKTFDHAMSTKFYLSSREEFLERLAKEETKRQRKYQSDKKIQAKHPEYIMKL